MHTVGVYCLDEESSRNRNSARTRENLRNTSEDILEMDEKSFITNFRLNKTAFSYVLKEIEDSFRQSTRSNVLSSKVKLAACLRFLAQGSYQQSVANDTNINISQSTFSVIFSSMLDILQEKLCSKWIRLDMTQTEINEAKNYFYEKCQIPGIIMCVDGTHIKILRPKENDHLFYNRKGYFSMNALIICDHMQRIRYVNGRYQGANHDSHIWNLSEAKIFLKNLYNNGDKNTRILGDSGYPLEPWLLTPFRATSENSKERMFNKKHSKRRNIIERTIGLLKSRFRCLLEMRSLHYDPSNVVKILNVCCALHNMCIHYKISMEDVELTTCNIQTENEEENENNNTASSGSYSRETIEIRQRIVDSM